MSNLLRDGPPVATLRCKVAVLGDAACGKSSLIALLESKGQSAVRNYKLTGDVEIKNIPIRLEEEPVSVEMILHDCPGQDVFHESLPKQLGNRINAILLVFDITDIESFRSIERWLEFSKTTLHTRDRPIVGVLIGNKLDLSKQRRVDEMQARDWATSRGLEYFETVASAAHDGSWKAPFMHLATEFYRAYDKKRMTVLEQFP